MPYIKKMVIAGNAIRIEKKYSSRYGSKGKCTRSQNFGKTPEAMAARNARYACQRAEDLFNANFKKGDLFITLTTEAKYRNSPDFDFKEAQRKWMRKLRKNCKAAGIPLKYIKAMESLEKNPHLHIVLEARVFDLLPHWEYGKPKNKLIDDRDYHTLGGYLKEDTHIKEGNQGKYEKTKERTQYSHSRNLIQPKETVEIISSDHWADEPKAPKGYYVKKDSLQNWEDEVSGYKHQSYILIKLPDKKPKPKQQAARRRC